MIILAHTGLITWMPVYLLVYRVASEKLCIFGPPCSSIVKGSPYSIAEHRVPELIAVLGSHPAGDVSHKPGASCHCFPPGLQLPPQPLRGLLPISLLGEQRHDGCEQFS